MFGLNPFFSGSNRFHKMLNYGLIDATPFDAHFLVSFFFFVRHFEEFFWLLVSIIACRRDLPVV